MERLTQHRRLNRRWWLLLLAGVLPWLLLVNVPELAQLPPMTLFVIGLCGLLPTLKVFPSYKRALWALKPPVDAALEDQRWAALASAQRNGMLWASLPAWLAALASPLGLEGVAGLLLVTGSVLLSLVYRIPRQVLLP
ncbi:MAG TPA: MFS transporter [Pseudomonas sp.]|uniref:MFS transporter n=1 Tax=Pseudomonas sp. TaxID=306 RepID=UPI002BD5843B|nr:MFS transporter [Pseudomonas sp.]HTO17556.1 MFS transporter [Pseudomonas sp.]